MLGGGNRRRTSTYNQPECPLPINSRAMVAFDQSAPNHNGQGSPFSTENTQNVAHNQKAESILNHSKQLQDNLQEIGEKIKHHEDNVKYLKSLKNKLDESILDMQVALGEYHTSFSSSENEDTAHVESEKETIQHILRHEKSAAALLCRIKSIPDVQVANHPFIKDVLGIVATLGKVDDDNLSRLLSEYLGLQTMLAVVCKTYEGVKALEAYNKDGSINKSLGLHAFAASSGMLLDDRFLVICLEHLRPYTGELIVGDPQRRLNLLKPRLRNGETPAGFLGFAVNMVSIDYSNLYCALKNGHSLRESLFYNLFSKLQVYRSREEMIKALPFIENGAISLDGGIIRSPGVSSLGHHREDVDVKFPIGSKRLVLQQSILDVENQMKETKWKNNRTLEDMFREQAVLDQTKLTYEIKKQEFLQCLAESSSYANQYQAGRVSTPR